MNNSIQKSEIDFDSDDFLKKHRNNIFNEVKASKIKRYCDFKEYLYKRKYDCLDNQLIIGTEVDGREKAWLVENTDEIDRLIEYSCISVDRLLISAKGKLVFYNCIIRSDIEFKWCDSLHIEFDSCIILGKIIIRNGKNISINITVSNVNVLQIIGLSDSKLLMNGNRLIGLFMNGIKLNNFLLVDNTIEYYNIIEYEVTSKSYNDFKQFNLENLGIEMPKNFDVENFCMHERNYIDITSKREKDCQQTIDALFDLTSISYDKDKLSDLKFKKSLLGNDCLGKAIVYLTAGFCKPYVWFLYVIGVILLFGAIYSMPGIQFDKGVTLDFWDAIYFSCITFSTVGYGDIAPIGVTRSICAAEGILGVSIMAGFITTLASKYTD